MSTSVLLNGFGRPESAPPINLDNDTGGGSRWEVRSEENCTCYVGDGAQSARGQSCRDWKRKLRRFCSIESWRRRLPITLWLPKYSLQDLKGDLIAGLTVGMTTVPQALAYAQIADLPPEYGLYSSFMACFAYGLFGTSKDLTLGVTAVISLLTSECIPGKADMYERTRYAVLLAFLVGVFQIAMGVFRLGFLFNLVSHPVLSGFTTASAFVIMFSQIKNLLGIPGGHTTDTVMQQGTHYVMNIHNLRGWDLLMGTCCISGLVIFRMIKIPRKSHAGSFVRETWRIIVAALPPLAPPKFSWNNQTTAENIEDMLSGLPFVALISAMETIAIAKAFGNKFGYAVDATQELMAIGVANFLSSFVSAYPVAGSFTKSSLNAQSGVRTPFGCFVTGFFVIVAQLTMAQAFCYVPKAALGAVILVSVVMLIDVKIIKELWQSNRIELIPLFGTITFSVFFGVDYGFLAGISFSFAVVMYMLTKPRLRLQCRTRIYMDREQPSLTRKVINIQVRPDGRIFFPATEPFKRYLINRVPDGCHIKRQGALEPLLQKLSVQREEQDKNGDIDSPKHLARDTKEDNIISPSTNLLQQPKQTVIFSGADLAKIDFTSLMSLHTVVSKFLSAGYAAYFVKTSVSTLRIILPKDQKVLIPAGKKSSELITLLVAPLSWRDRTMSVPVVIDMEDLDEINLVEPMRAKNPNIT
ncbi:sodium-independent sulfate anion transporter-like isoform X2 [Paramacrobiotus metropolitanus]|uniref:sodium-independent sulfate anion transporter-like isoform X2 n=1 Tax=Paramacrobiotus metropolitanus TaxID=2943436 RepID=UPI0024459D40|nr:sodium-independent sulfate anion transporter-like isoform X2 [Paramacrobiotus metropolitanus]